MTDIEIRNQGAIVPLQSTGGTDLRLWAEQATAAAVYAEAICRTSMVPSAYKGKPEEATAAILAGAELGLSPMASLRAFDNIQGVPAPKALMLRAVVLGQGHEVKIVETTPERAQVAGRRRGDDEWQISVWDLDRARKLDLLKKDQWQKQPQAMLVARATAEVCRWIAADAIMGMPYAAEEIEDQPALAPSPVARRLTVTDLDEQPALEQPADDGQMVTRDQQKHMFALWNELGFTGEENRANRLEITGKILGVEGLESSNDLTRAEADRVIAALRERKERTADGDPA